MSKIGDKIKTYRDELGLTQAAVAEAVGTSQQTVDRIERGAVEHSRYTLPILVWIEAQYEQRHLQGEIKARDEYLDATTAQFVPSVTLESGALLPDGSARVPDTLVHLKDSLYSVRIVHRVQGPMGDVIFRRGDRLFLYPMSAPPNHFDLCLVRPRDGDEGPVEFRYVLDRAQMPGLIEAVASAYAWADDQGKRFDKIAAVFPA